MLRPRIGTGARVLKGAERTRHPWRPWNTGPLAAPGRTRGNRAAYREAVAVSGQTLTAVTGQFSIAGHARR